MIKEEIKIKGGKNEKGKEELTQHDATKLTVMHPLLTQTIGCLVRAEKIGLLTVVIKAFF